MVTTKKSKYISNLIIIEYQQQINRRIKHHTHQNNLVVSSTLKFQYITSYLGTVFPPSSLKTSGRK